MARTTCLLLIGWLSLHARCAHRQVLTSRSGDVLDELPSHVWYDISSPFTDNYEELEVAEVTSTPEPQPCFEGGATSANVTVQFGASVFLHCRVNHLRDKTPQLEAHTMQTGERPGGETSTREDNDSSACRQRAPSCAPGNVQEVLRLSPALNFSFMALVSLQEAGLYEPRANHAGGVPPKAHSGRYLSRALWLSYNCLHSAAGLAQLASALLELPHMLSWIDLSFNRLETVPVEDLMELKGLRTLYLHANRLRCMQQVCELRNSAGLHSLTLHGNPLQAEPGYRQLVLICLPQLTSLDFCLVLPSERPDPGSLNKITSSDSPS